MYGRRIVFSVLVVMVAACLPAGRAFAQGKEEKKNDVVSFKKNVFPIINAKCLPCHAEDNFNPSELNLDSYDAMMKGGKHGELVKAGKSKESLLLDKIGNEPKFGDRMPLNSKRKIAEGKAVWLTEAEVKIIATWIDQGAKNN